LFKKTYFCLLYFVIQYNPMQKPTVSIILPTYNEKGNISSLILTTNRIVKDNKEIIVVDDNSPDGTAQEVTKLIKDKSVENLKLILRQKDRGLTNSIWEGIKKSKGEIIIWMDCDFSHPPRIIPVLLKNIKSGNDIVVASRFIKGGGFKKNLKDSSDFWLAVVLSRLMNHIIQFLLNNNFRDYTSGFIAIRRKVFKDIILQGNYGEYFIDLIFRAILLGYSYKEIPFVNLPRKNGESKTGSDIKTLVRHGVKYIMVAIKLGLIKIKYNLNLINKNDIKSQRQRFV